MNKLITQIVEHTFGETPTLIEEILGKGKVNLVYKISLKDSTYILRMQKGEEAFSGYQKEKWCMNTVSELGVPTPRCIAIGKEGEYGFSFQEFIEGRWGKDLPQDAKGQIWFTLGEYAKKFNTIPAPQYKVDFEDVERKLFGDGFFVTHKIFSQEKILQIQERIDEVKLWQFEPMLCHGNLHPSNVILHPSGTMYLIDWGSAVGHRLPQAELAEIYTWNTGKSNIELFLKGYGSDVQTAEEMMRDIQTLVLIRLLTGLRWNIENKSDAKGLEFVESTTKTIGEIKDFGVNILFSKNI